MFSVARVRQLSRSRQSGPMSLGASQACAVGFGEDAWCCTASGTHCSPASGPFEASLWCKWGNGAKIVRDASNKDVQVTIDKLWCCDIFGDCPTDMLSDHALWSSTDPNDPVVSREPPVVDICPPGNIKDRFCCGPNQEIQEGSCVDLLPAPPAGCGPGKYEDEAGKCLVCNSSSVEPGTCFRQCGPNEAFDPSDLTCACKTGFKRTDGICIAKDSFPPPYQPPVKSESISFPVRTIGGAIIGGLAGLVFKNPKLGAAIGGGLGLAVDLSGSTKTSPDRSSAARIGKL